MYKRIVLKLSGEALDCDLSEIVVYTPNTSKTVDKCESQSVYKQKV